jgi:hypothetical protein
MGYDVRVTTLRVTLYVSLLLANARAFSNTLSEPLSDDSVPGMTRSEFRDFAERFPSLPGRIEAIQLFSGSKGRLAALATFDRTSGWQVLIFGLSGEATDQLVWSSGKLPDSFYVADSSALKRFSFGQEQGISFEGCAQHTCPDIFSILLYVPSRHQQYTLNYVQGKVTYSRNLEESDAAEYKRALNQMLKVHLDETGMGR